MTERFNVAGAMLTKLYGRPNEEAAGFSNKSGRVRDIGVVTAMYGRVFFTALVLVASLATAVIYGLGGSLVIKGVLQLGTLVALTALLTRLYGPLTALSNVQVDVMTALVSFDRVFEVLDLKPMVGDRPGATALRARGGASDRLRARFLPLSGCRRGVARVARIDRDQVRRTRPGTSARYCTTCPSAPSRVSSPRSSGRRAQERPRSRTWCRGCTTSLLAPC